MRTWFITGVSTGFGRALAETLLSRGERVVGTLRNEDQRAEFSKLSEGKSFGYLLDVRNHDDVRRVVAQVEEEVGAIDVLVNNAGYGYEGSVEEATPEAIRAQFDVNLFGAVSVLQASQASCWPHPQYHVDGWPDDLPRRWRL
jgi:NAD(P)-dependent dehydrogenase (short-subunit alcohol dehydrogenase family)